MRRHLAFIIENDKTSYADLLANNGRILVTLGKGNGGQPVMTVTGPGFDPKQPARVHTHYHGDNATIADPVGSKAGTTARILEVLKRNPQTVFVLPEAVHRDGSSDWHVDSAKNDNYYKASWGNVRSQAETTDDALAAAGVTRVSKEIVSVHSRGGEALTQVMKDKSGAGLRCDRLEIHDALYGQEASVTKWAATDNGKAVHRVVYYHGTNDAGRDNGFDKLFRFKYTRVDMSKQPDLDNKIDPVLTDASNKPIKRDSVWVDHDGKKHVWNELHQFNPDPHYRTTGQFLDASD
jgi:hypothetical protein